MMIPNASLLIAVLVMSGFSTSIISAGAVSPPAQVALAAGMAADSQVAFTWITNDKRRDSTSCHEVTAVQIYQYDVDGGRHDHKAIATDVLCNQYFYGSMLGNYTSGRIHHVTISGLEPETTYHYRLHGDPVSVERHFRTMPASLSPGYPLTLGVTGDLGQTEESLETVRHLDADKDLKMILHPGDMAYADSNGSRWDIYGTLIEPLSSRLQWMVCPGNHEIESDTFTGQSFVPYEHRFTMPAVQAAVSSPSREQLGCVNVWPYKPSPQPFCTPSVFTGEYDWGNSFYAFTAGPARIVVLNSYTNTEPGSPQHSWLKNELATLSQHRAQTPWLIVIMHCPFYSSNKAHHNERQAVLMRDAHGFEELFFLNNVSIVLSGHVHAYERSHPVYRNATNSHGPTYVVIGDGGNREGHAHHYIEPAPSFSAFRNGTNFGHGKITLANETHMRWEWFVNDEAQMPTLSAEAATRRAAEHAHAGADIRASAQMTQGWYDTLPSRVAHDAAWICNPLSFPCPLSTSTRKSTPIVVQV